MTTQSKLYAMRQNLLPVLERADREIKHLRNKIADMAPKAEAYDMMRIALIGPFPPNVMGEDITWEIKMMIDMLNSQQRDAEKAAMAEAKPPLKGQPHHEEAVHDHVESGSSPREKIEPLTMPRFENDAPGVQAGPEEEEEEAEVEAEVEALSDGKPPVAKPIDFQSGPPFEPKF